MNIWIWTELLAFDSESPDLGVSEYLGKMKQKPAGFSLFVSSIDFILQHENWTAPHDFPADICSRNGHDGNGVRKRQIWNSEQLKRLVKLLHANGCKVIISVFCGHMNNRFHHEWLTDHPECTVAWHGRGMLNLIGRLADGTLFEDLFVRKLMEVEAYYDLDGWHGPDNCGPGATIFKAYHGNSFMRQFQEHVGETRLPEMFRGDLANEQQGVERLNWIWENLRDEWTDFFIGRWESFWKKTIDALHQTGRIAVINSPDTKSIFGSIYYLGFDYRRIARLGVDMIVMENASISFSLGRGQRDYMTEFAAVMQEIAVAMPGIKTCMMPCIKDAVESFDSLEHFRTMCERDHYYYASRQLQKNGSLQPTADDYLFCLGDFVTANDWEWLDQVLNTAGDFKAVKSGDLVWLHDAGIYEALRAEYRVRGTPESCYQISRMEELGCLDISTIAGIDELPSLNRPLIVPNFHLLSEDAKQKLLAKKQLLAVLGVLTPGVDYPENAVVIKVPASTGVTFSCAIINSALPPEEIIIKGELDKEFDTAPAVWHLYADLPPAIAIPNEFWITCGTKVTLALGGSPLEKGGRSLGIYGTHPVNGNEVSYYRQWDEKGTQRIGLYSRVYTYRIPKYHLPEGTPVAPVTAFPRTLLHVQNGYIVSSDCLHKSVNIPPCGIIILEAKS